MLQLQDPTLVWYDEMTVSLEVVSIDSFAERHDAEVSKMLVKITANKLPKLFEIANLFNSFIVISLFKRF